MHSPRLRRFRPRRFSLPQFIEAQLSSLNATAVDFLFTALLFRIMEVNYVWATMLGSVAGGVLNCITNYRWVFRGTSLSKRRVALRYFAVWVGSIALNTWGVAATVWLISRDSSPTLSMLMMTKCAIAVLVAFGWNFLMQKHWVFKR